MSSSLRRRSDVRTTRQKHHARSDYVYQGEQHFGARLMVEEGVLKNPDVDAIFGFHVTSKAPTGVIGYRSGPTMASSSDVSIVNNYATTVNDPALTQQMLPTLKRVAPKQVFEVPLVTGSEDFSYYAKEVPGLFFSSVLRPWKT